jgi:hypothetical protein
MQKRLWQSSRLKISSENVQVVNPLLIKLLIVFQFENRPGRVSLNKHLEPYFHA